MQGEAAAGPRGREDTHHEGAQQSGHVVSGMMEVMSVRSPLPSTSSTAGPVGADCRLLIIVEEEALAENRSGGRSDPGTGEAVDHSELNFLYAPVLSEETNTTYSV